MILRPLRNLLRDPRALRACRKQAQKTHVKRSAQRSRKNEGTFLETKQDLINCGDSVNLETLISLTPPQVSSDIESQIGNVKSSKCNDSHQIHSKMLHVFSMEVPYQSSKPTPASVSPLLFPFTDKDKSKQISDNMIYETGNMEDDNAENQNNTSFPVTGSEPLLSILNNVKVKKEKAINNPTLTESRGAGSSAANGDGKNSNGRLSNNTKEGIANNRHKKRALPETDEEQTGEGFVPVTIGVYNSLKTELSSAKLVGEELCDTIALWK